MTAKALWAVAFLLTFLVYTADSQRTVRLNRDGTLKVLFFSDIHFGEETQTSGTSVDCLPCGRSAAFPAILF